MTGLDGGGASLDLSRSRPAVRVTEVTDGVTDSAASTAEGGGVFWGRGATGPPTAPMPRSRPRSPSVSVSSESGDNRSEPELPVLPVPALSSRSAETRAKEPDRRDREKVKRRRQRLLRRPEEGSLRDVKPS